MSGFKNHTFNQNMAKSIFKNVISKVLVCCDMMQKDCLEQKVSIRNMEEDIRDYLFANYLNNDDIMEQVGLSEFRFFSEVPENYQNNKPKGRTDLQLINMNMFKYRNRYYTIECKRIDGSKVLNRYYVNNGVKRFVLPNPLYSSYYRTNCMFAFVVKDINMDMTTKEISSLEKNYSDIKVKYPLSSILISEQHPCTYQSEYYVDNDSDILLFHIFYDFSQIIECNS